MENSFPPDSKLRLRQAGQQGKGGRWRNLMKRRVAGAPNLSMRAERKRLLRMPAADLPGSPDIWNRSAKARRPCSRVLPGVLRRNSFGASVPMFTGRTPSSTLIHDGKSPPAMISSPRRLLMGALENGENTNTVCTLRLFFKAQMLVRSRSFKGRSC